VARKSYPSDVKDDEWEFVAPYLALIREDAPQREHDLREIYDALRWVVRAGAPWRMIPIDLPPWAAVYQRVQRWITAGVFEEMVHDLREILLIAADREAHPTAVVIDSRTLQSTPESGHRGAYDGAKRKKGLKVRIAVDTLRAPSGAARDARRQARPLGGEAHREGRAEGDGAEGRAGVRRPVLRRRAGPG
jgi:transposase